MQKRNNFADSVYPGKRCAEEIKLNNYNNIENCANSTEGSQLLQKKGELTFDLKPALGSVPTIVFKHVSDFDKVKRIQRRMKIIISIEYSNTTSITRNSHWSISDPLSASRSHPHRSNARRCPTVHRIWTRLPQLCWPESLRWLWPTDWCNWRWYGLFVKTNARIEPCCLFFFKVEPFHFVW